MKVLRSNMMTNSICMTIFLCCMTSHIFSAQTIKSLPQGVKDNAIKFMPLRGKVAIIMVSDHTGKKDSAQLAQGLFEKDGYTIRSITTVISAQLSKELQRVRDDAAVDIIAIIGGTGMSDKDTTIETILAIPDIKELPGFGERLRRLTDERWDDHTADIGLLSLATRATAIVVDHKVIFAIPGSPDAVDIAMKDIILPGLPRLLGNFTKDKN